MFPQFDVLMCQLDRSVGIGGNVARVPVSLQGCLCCVLAQQLFDVVLQLKSIANYFNYQHIHLNTKQHIK